MELHLLLEAVGYIILIVIGIPGNLTILILFAHIRISTKKLLPIDLILTNLAFVNVITILSEAIPQCLTAFGLHRLFSDVECMIVIFSFFSTRGMSICITSLLSCYQLIIIFPHSSKITIFKNNILKRVFQIISLLWCFNIFIYVWILPYSYSDAESFESENIVDLEYCVIIFPNYSYFMTIGAVRIFRDFLFLILMVIASTFIVLILYRHNRNMKHTLNSSRIQSDSTEGRVAKGVVTMVVMYIFFYGVDNIFWLYTLCILKASPEISDMRTFFTTCYSVFSSVIIILMNKKIKRALKLAIPCIKSQSRENIVSHVQI
ncbi:olfactory receptor class A-like protein 1 [Protopterus annectens]|uniref:olfactory receptor class A-like protein 1 n=1 Tax=Protopterus annectens TaxID=7888 RepID=UPI001CFBC429|nr:olfactory receptor class A-like protein 1 [Protopterus annectens]